MTTLWSHEDALAHKLIECDISGACAVCAAHYTKWRLVAVDFHICSVKCFADAKEFFEHMKPIVTARDDLYDAQDPHEKTK